MIEKLAEQSTVFDSDKQHLGAVYAKALLSHGKEIGKLDALVDQLEAVNSAVREIPALQATLESPRIAYEAKASMIDKAFGNRVDKVLVNFLKLVVSRGRFDCLPAIASSSKEMQNEIAGRVEAVLTSAAEVDESVKNSIADRLSKVIGKSVVLTAVVDPSIVGGFTVRVGDTVYDASLANQLVHVRKKAVQKASDRIREKLESFISG